MMQVEVLRSSQLWLYFEGRVMVPGGLDAIMRQEMGLAPSSGGGVTERAQLPGTHMEESLLVGTHNSAATVETSMAVPQKM